MGKFKEGTIRKYVLDELVKLCSNSQDRKINIKEAAEKISSLHNFNKGTVFGTLRFIQSQIQSGELFQLGLNLDCDFEKGNFFLVNQPTNIGNLENKGMKSLSIKEEDFYQPFADFLVNHLKECVKAISLGGAQFKDKWGTPDVLGIFKFPDIAPIKPFPEIVSAEIKLDETQIITAFGQACAYKLFSHKVYLVIPSSTPEEDISRTESLCMKFGIGLITFDKDNPQNPNFTIRTRAIKHEPDYSFVNNYLHKLTFEQQNKLFG